MIHKILIPVLGLGIALSIGCASMHTPECGFYTYLKVCPTAKAAPAPKPEPVAEPEPKPAPKPEPEPKPTPRVVVKADKIELADKVRFETNSAVLLAESNTLLSEVVDVLKKNPSVTLVSIEGHTDNQGSASLNLDLSKRRAKAVVDYLVKNGIEAKRLRSRGFGLTKPIAGNDTDEGRAKNRRVEFNIVEQAPKETAAKD